MDNFSFKTLLSKLRCRSFCQWSAQFGGLIGILFLANFAFAQNSPRPDLFEKAKTKVREKCSRYSGQANRCLLTEQELDPDGRPDRYIFFRGESKERKTIVTSAYARWAFSKTGPCKDGCTSQRLKDEFLTDLKALPLFASGTRIFQTSDRSWRLTHQTETAISPEQLMWDIIARHLVGYASIGSDLTMNDTAEMFDPFISFSASPYIAETFAGASSPGVLLMISVPKAHIERPSADECQLRNFDPAKFYDLYPCFGAAGSVEAEYDAFLSLPKEYIYSLYRFPKRQNQ
jgi:hypothetical protein